ncbi:MAG: hypothetical protein JWQ20_1919 [Conexibacter sp.]|nr:hypothetical protein [Solirubrobacterales bacterium]MCW3002621.1 hypothetical protein [Conexibacter sp.]
MRRSPLRLAIPCTAPGGAGVCRCFFCVMISENIITATSILLPMDCARTKIAHPLEA